MLVEAKINHHHYHQWNITLFSWSKVFACIDRNIILTVFLTVGATIFFDLTCAIHESRDIISSFSHMLSPK